ncbi:hypothetical protein CTI12_AA171530 [Artemisia annua]|uniref:Uncharacterized protein n=1 Tax=Artemisia annua TaxID=35608 RepID=A0A2U1PBD2_ARTAN|nr:hypothetical protein CTI12_AA171530 [Artemisia annua]
MRGERDIRQICKRVLGDWSISRGNESVMAGYGKAISQFIRRLLERYLGEDGGGQLSLFLSLWYAGAFEIADAAARGSSKFRGGYTVEMRVTGNSDKAVSWTKGPPVGGNTLRAFFVSDKEVKCFIPGIGRPYSKLLQRRCCLDLGIGFIPLIVVSEWPGYTRRRTNSSAVYVSKNLLSFLFIAVGLNFCIKLGILSTFPIETPVSTTKTD